MRLVFDIGCNVGNWISANLRTDTLFVGVDANPEVIRVCAEKYFGNPNVVLHNLLVSDIDNGLADFYVASTHWASTPSIEFKERGRFADVMRWSPPVPTRTITLDSLIKLYTEPDYIKIDVEGYELTALRGLTHKSGMMAFEWNEEEKINTIECIRHCYSIGYRQFAVYEEDNYTYIPDSWADYEDICDKVDELLITTRANKWGMIYCK